MATERAALPREMINRAGQTATAEVGCLTLDLAAVAANYRLIQAKAPAARVGAVVKADAYGLGANTVAPVLAGAGCRDFFVAHLAEALDLVSVLPQPAQLYVLNGLAPGMESLCADRRILPVLNTLEQARAWQGYAESVRRKLPAVLQVDTGMSRLGLGADELEILLRQSGFLDWVELRVVMSHLACADMPEAHANAEQVRRFAAMAARLPGVETSLANSAAALGLSDRIGNLVRPGLALYGIDPLLGKTRGLHPAITLDATMSPHRPAGSQRFPWAMRMGCQGRLVARGLSGAMASGFHLSDGCRWIRVRQM